MYGAAGGNVAASHPTAFVPSTAKRGLVEISPAIVVGGENSLGGYFGKAL